MRQLGALAVVLTVVLAVVLAVILALVPAAASAMYILSLHTHAVEEGPTKPIRRSSQHGSMIYFHATIIARRLH